jgi:hypothetical protein
MTISSPETETTADGVAERRIGKSSYWVLITQEPLGSAQTWRIAILKKPARASKGNPPTRLIYFSPQNPLFTLEIDGQRFPLVISKLSTSRVGKVVIGGTRRVGESLCKVVTWTATLTPSDDAGTATIAVDARFRCTGATGQRLVVGVRVPLALYQPSLIKNALPDVPGISTAALWADRAETAIAMLIPSGDASPINLVEGILTAEITDVDPRGKTPLILSIALRSATSEIEAQQLIRTRTAESALLTLPDLSLAPRSLLDASRRGIEHLLDSKNCTQVGKERWYFRASGEFDYGPGFPYFSIETAPVLMRWNKFYGNEVAERIARLTSRGVASDFAVIVGDAIAEGNKGAFWDCAAGAPGALIYSTFNHKNQYGIASNARIANALFDMYDESPDALLRQAALNTCHWLILKQNHVGYYNGPFVDASTGSFTKSRANFDGLLAIRPLVAAFRACGNEVFIKSAWKVANYLKNNISSGIDAFCLYDLGTEQNCPIALSAAVHAVLDLDHEAPNESLRKIISILSDHFAMCRFDTLGHNCLNYDGACSGSLECAIAALRLFSFTGNLKWFHLGCTLIKHVVELGVTNWRIADATLSLLVSLGGLLPGATVDIKTLSVTLAWCKFAPDAAAAQYFDVRDQLRNPVDFIPLVCRETNQTILLILPTADIFLLQIVKRNSVYGRRIPVFDLVANAHCSLEAPTHALPFDLGRFAVIRIDP